MKIYLVPAVGMLMVITSMGIFGFLSKAHSDQSLISGDVLSKIAIYDEKIKTQKENIEANRRALKQMDEGVDSVLGRSTDEKGADKAVALRKTQQKERIRLQAEISQSQKSIAELNDIRAPIAAEVRKVEAEVGPIKYIAALIYGDNPDANILEKAVVWVIMMIVAVFDPLALVLILAAQHSIRWAQEEKKEHYEPDEGPLTDNQIEQIRKMAQADLPVGKVVGRAGPRNPCSLVGWPSGVHGYRVSGRAGVLVPRADTETLVEAALELLSPLSAEKLRVADVCTGSGCAGYEIFGTHRETRANLGQRIGRTHSIGFFCGSGSRTRIRHNRHRDFKSQILR
jgi:hypothetical protein